MDFNLWKDLNDGKNVIAFISLKYPRIREKIKEKLRKKIGRQKLYFLQYYKLRQNCNSLNSLKFSQIEIINIHSQHYIK